MILAAADGDRKAARALDDAAYWMGFGLRALARLFNPEVIVLGGTLGQVLEARTDLLMETLHERDGIDFAQNVEVRSGALGSDAPLLGAAEAAFGPLLSDPVSVMTAYRKTQAPDSRRRGRDHPHRLPPPQPRRGLTSWPAAVPRWIGSRWTSADVGGLVGDTDLGGSR